MDMWWLGSVKWLCSGVEGPCGLATSSVVCYLVAE